MTEETLRTNYHGETLAERNQRRRSTIKALITTSGMAGIYCAAAVIQFLTYTDSIHAVASESDRALMHVMISVPVFIFFTIYTESYISRCRESEGWNQENMSSSSKINRR